MRGFITGASGWGSSAITAELIAANHQVKGLIRSEAKAQALRGAGEEAVLGSPARLG